MKKVSLGEWIAKANERFSTLERRFDAFVQSSMVRDDALNQRVKKLENPPIKPIKGTRGKKSG
jgi:hypothetical protein